MTRILVLFILIFAACDSGSQVHSPVDPFAKTTELHGSAMTIDYRIIIGKSALAGEIAAIDNIVKAIFVEIDTIFNIWNPISEISRLNRLRANEGAVLSPAMENFLYSTDRVVRLTGGLFDPTIEPMHRLWKEKLTAGKVPLASEISAISPAIGWEKIHFKDGVFYKDHDKTALDFGGNAKGHCVDLIIERLNAAGWADLFVEWGGEIRTSGRHPDNRPWRCFISRLGDSDPDNGIAGVDLIDTALATSGDYLQNWSVNIDGKRVTYSHIIDPRTHFPLLISPSSIASASIMAPNCALADGIATAAMLQKNLEEGVVWLKQLQEQVPLDGYWLISRENKYLGNSNEEN